MSSVEEIVECPKCKGKCGHVINIGTGEEWCGCLEPNCDYGWGYTLNQDTGELEEVVGKVTFHQIPNSELHPIDQLPMQILIDNLDLNK